MANSRRALFLLVLVSSLALLVTSCASAPAPSTTVPSTPAPAATTAGAGTFDGTIVFGAAVSLTGSTSNEGRYTKDGYETAKDAVNAAGGIQVAGKRYKIDIKYYDDASKADQTSQLVEKLITEDKVTFLLGPYGSAPTNTAAAIVEKYKMPMVEAN